MEIKTLSEVPEHLETLAKWHHQQWGYMNPDNTLENRIAGMRNSLSADAVPQIHIALEDGHVLGSAAIVEHDMSTHKEWSPWLASVFVNPDFRQKGIGGKLVQSIMNYAKEQGFDKIYLFTPDKRAFYERLGWQFLATEPYCGSNQDILIFEP